MRIFLFFMTILTLSLSCLPCGDVNVTVVKEGKTQYELAKCADGDQHEDDCPPFCHCSCCANFSIHHQVSTAQHAYSSRSLMHAARYVESIRQVSMPVWQPPQLG